MKVICHREGCYFNIFNHCMHDKYIEITDIGCTRYSKRDMSYKEIMETIEKIPEKVTQ